jgi:hypothetical protein
MAHPWEWLTRRSWEQRQGGPCPECGDYLVGTIDEDDAIVWACMSLVCRYTAPVPVDVQLRWQGAPMLPGFA